MQIKLIERLGDWNPQLLREIRAIRTSNLLITATMSLLGQFLLFIHLQAQLPISLDPTIPIVNRYCLTRVAATNDYPNCLRDAAGNFIINWQLWWLNWFILSSLFAIVILLVGGVYLLVNDLATENRRGTLNFIRLSPQSSQTILFGKLLGVPILIYLALILVLPLHLWAGLSAKIPLHLILGFYIIVGAGCFFFYSAAILFGLVSSAFGFSPWLASAVVLVFLLMNHYSVTGTLIDWLFLFSPNQIIPYLAEATYLNSNYMRFVLLSPTVYSNRWYNFEIDSVTNVVLATLLNYGLWSYWTWQAIKQRYANPIKPLLTQQQSYLLVACFEVAAIGFTSVTRTVEGWREGMIYHYHFLLIFNLVMFLMLILSMTPSRSALQYQESEARSLLKTLEKSVLSTIGINLAIASLFLVSWIFLNLTASAQTPALLSLLIFCNFILFCAAITQILVIRVTQKPALWIVGTFGAVTILPVIIVQLIARTHSETLMLWLYTPYAWAATQAASMANIVFAISSQWLIIGLFTLQMVRDIKKISESKSKVLFASSKS